MSENQATGRYIGLSRDEDPKIRAIYDELREIAKEHGPVTLTSIQPDVRKPEIVRPFSLGIDPVFGEGFKRGELQIFMAKGRGR
ncbi:hypothetical protein [Methylorubrum extorquens]|uniref:hypothetical protein n=1 Tax=Methylorubrum extorquens TaxID=408 RepID=UPI00209FBD0F|nr:hypothetical protein [Methylorubrum extorquens]MCP1540098.1 hypothetical protein [Methylorubrum extorquens]